MTWRQAVSAWKQGTNGFYMAIFDANGKLLTGLPRARSSDCRWATTTAP